MARLAETSAADLIPTDADLESLRSIAKGCTACVLHLTGTQTVFGEGPRRAEVMMVGEQPGDVEDRAGQPFVGPAGKLLNGVFEDVGIDRSRVYVTNVVQALQMGGAG